MQTLGQFIAGILYMLLATATAMVGYTIHHDAGFATLDFLFWPICWIKWLVLKQVNLTIIKATFAFFLT